MTLTPRLRLYCLCCLYCLLGGLPLTIAAQGAGHFGWWWLSGIVLSAAFVPVAIYGPRSMWAQFVAIAPALFVISVFCTWTEAMVFMPRFRQDAVASLVGGAVMYVLVAAALALLARALRLTRFSDPADHGVPHRSAFAAVALVVACGLAYALYYLVFGSITYQYFTKGFYPEATQQVFAFGVGRFWAMQIGRGVLMTAAVLPIVYTLRMPRLQAALVVGAIVWVAGGLSLLLVPNELLGPTQRVIHIVEIFTQNASLGATVVLLMRPVTARRAPLPTYPPASVSY